MKEFIYRLVNMVMLGKGLPRTINGFKLWLPTRYFKYFPADYEKENFELLSATCREGGLVMDIGAHIGLFAVIASKVVGKTGKVLAFEPAPSTFKLLQKTVAINKKEDTIDVFQKAVGRKVGKTVFFVSDGEADNSNSLVSYLEDRPLHGIDIDVTTIDAVVAAQNLSKLDFIKMDVEGAEFDTLHGAVQTLNTLRPVCIVAIHPNPILAKGDTLEGIYDFIESCRYRITLHGEPLAKEKFIANRELIDLHIYPL